MGKLKLRVWSQLATCDSFMTELLRTEVNSPNACASPDVKNIMDPAFQFLERRDV